MYTFLYSNKGEKAQTKVCHEAGGSVERPLLVSQPQPGVIHSLGVWGPKRSALTRRRQLGEGRAQGLPIVFPILTALCRGIWWHGPFPCATRDIAGGGGRPGMGASHQFLQDTSILPGSLFTPSPSREQTFPGNRACGAAAMREGIDTKPNPQCRKPSSSFVTYSRAATYTPMEIQGNFMFVCERTLDASWGEDL